MFLNFSVFVTRRIVCFVKTHNCTRIYELNGEITYLINKVLNVKT